MISLETDILNRALSDLQVFCSKYESSKESQRLRDLEAEISGRNKEVGRLMGEYEDAIRAATMLESRNKALSLALKVRADMLLGEANKLRPLSLIKKKEDLEVRISLLQSIAGVVNNLSAENLSG
jgi:hypothetical protein